MENLENLFSYTSVQWDIVSHILTLGYAAHAAAFVYFLATMGRVSPRYRMSSVLAAVVMVSAFFILYEQSQSWRLAFTWDRETSLWVPGENTFSNGYRYINWSIDVPMLLLQLVAVLGMAHARSIRVGTKFVVAGLLMIYTGYIGQYYETSETSMQPFYFWFGISWIFYAYILWLVWTTISQELPNLPREAASIMGFVRWWILVTWTLYTLAYIVPAFADNAWGMVSRQAIYTTADILSKIIYGIMISQVAEIRSQAEDFKPAIEARAD